MKTVFTNFRTASNWAIPLVLAVMLFCSSGQIAHSADIEIIERSKELNKSDSGWSRYCYYQYKTALGMTADLVQVRVAFESNSAKALYSNYPNIQTHPQSQTVYEGETIKLYVYATCDLPLTYQWFHNYSTLVDEKYTTLTIGRATKADSGDYWVEVRSVWSWVPSARAKIRVIPRHPFVLKEQPATIRECEGATNLILKVSVDCSEGAVAHYQWYKDGSRLKGDTNAVLKLPTLTASVTGMYMCNIWDPKKDTVGVWSNIGQVYLYDKPEILGQDTLIIAKSGQSTTLNVTALPVDPVDTSFHTIFQWYKRKAGSEDEKLTDGELYSGTNTAQLIIKTVGSNEFLLNKDGYFLEVEGKCGKTNSKLIHVSPGIGIVFNSENPGNIDGCPWWETTNDQQKLKRWSYTVSLKPIAYYHFDSVRFEHITSLPSLWYDNYGIDNVKTFSWEEFKQFDKKNYSVVSKPFNYTPNHLQNQTHKLRVTFFPGNEVFESPGVSWIFHDIQEIAKQPQSLTIEEGTDFTLSIEAKCDLPLTYQWRRNGDLITDQTNPTLAIINPSLGDAGAYLCEVRSECDTVFSDTAIVIVKTKGVINPDEKYTSKENISINPNPASEVLEISFNTERLLTSSFKILELSGREVMSFTCAPGEYRISKDISGLVSGTYFILIESAGERFVKRFSVIK